jgi:hypothetical protein
MKVEAGSGSDRTSSTFDVVLPSAHDDPRRFTRRPLSPISTSGMMKTLAFHHSAQGKSDRMSELSVEPAVANQHQRNDENLGFSSFRPRKVGHEVRAFRENYTRS